MKRHIFIALAITLFGAVWGVEAQAQAMSERRDIRRGNRLFEKGEYAQSVKEYEEALKTAPGSFEAKYNLANAAYKSGNYQQAAQALESAIKGTKQKSAQAKALYNKGNAEFKERKFKEAMQSYRSSLVLNPDDKNAKFNYAYAKKMLQEQQQDDKQDKQQNKQDQQDKQQQPQQQPDKGQNNDQNGQDKPDKGDESQPQNGQGGNSGGISREEQQQMLDAIQAQEDKTQEKVKREAARGAVIPNGKNW